MSTQASAIGPPVATECCSRGYSNTIERPIEWSTKAVLNRDWGPDGGIEFLPKAIGQHEYIELPRLRNKALTDDCFFTLNKFTSLKGVDLKCNQIILPVPLLFCLTISITPISILVTEKQKRDCLMSETRYRVLLIVCYPALA